jgi:stage II sporulation protein R
MIKNTKLICSLLLLTIMVLQGTALAVPDVVRLHVIANSDSTRDQYIKELVRDRIVADLGPVFSDMNRHQVERWILENKHLIAGMASEVLSDTGSSHQVQIVFGIGDYPTRAYGPVAYPAGKYRSLQIILGAGEGRNWWCLMFPPLCFVEESAASSGNTGGEKKEDVKIRFWLVDKISALLRNIGVW